MAAIEAPALASASLTRRSIPAALRLSTDAGWNQTADDWGLFVDHGRVGGVFADTELVATAATLPYGTRLGYVAMVLVDPRFRNRGIATRLLRDGITDLEARNATPMLDATPAGAVVYRRLGFEEVCPLRRWQGEGRDRHDVGLHIRAAATTDAERLIALDAVAFGAPRAYLIENFLARPGTHVLVSDAGFVIRRRGIRADQIGPLVAADVRGAQELLAAALDLSPGPVFLDVFERENGLADMLQTRQFRVQRPFIRMALGRSAAFGDCSRLFVAAGPEFG